ncbi:rod shape-determining protein MreC [Paenibacillus selenitireducens]|uniref:rod shape-determining protein MreC n=1 Tax=Paenibacillus selenitireducens TaxID=1324314 RepID=UPI001E3EA24B|nr:rod shape-determining protein MreC [Paenibacillus selenitireducens]
MFILLLGMILFISLLGFTLSKRENLSWPEKMLNDTFGFAQNMIYKPAGFIAGLFEDISNLNHIYEENEQLKIAVSHYIRDKANYNFIAAENERLQKALNFTEQQKKMYKYDYKIAQVVSVNQDPYNYTITINIGEKNGVKKNQAVTSVDGMVGVISQVSPLTSTVQLLTGLDERNPNSNAIAATAIGKENKSFGLIESYNAQEGTYLMTKIDENDPLAVGDTIISSGIGEAFPRGIVIGTVLSTQVGDFGLTHTATIKPAVNFDNWKELFVVVPM